MSLPSEAAALLKAVLRSPDDETPRLVLADWLEESGSADHAAWAEYIRAATVAHVGAMMPIERRLRLNAVGERVKARLDLPVRFFIDHCPALVNVLPPANFDIRLGGFTPPRAVLHHVRRYYQYVSDAPDLLPIDWSGHRPGGRPPRWTQRTIVAVSPDPVKLANGSSYFAELTLTGGLVCATAEADEIAEAWGRAERVLADEAEVLQVAFGPGGGWEVENIPSEDRPPDSVEPVAWLAHRLLDDALRDRGRAVQFRPIGVLVQVRIMRQGRWHDWRAVSPQLYEGVLAEYRRASDIGAAGVGTLKADLSGRTVELPIELSDTPHGPGVWVDLPHRLEGRA